MSIVMTTDISTSAALTVMVQIQRQDGSIQRIAERVDLDRDLADVRSELWREIHLRRGHLTGLDAFACRLELRRTDEGLCTGYALLGTAPGGVEASLPFPLTSLAPIAQRVAGRLEVGSDDRCTYELTVTTTEELASASIPRLTLRPVDSTRSRYLVVPGLMRRLESAEQVGIEEGSNRFPVVFLRKVLERCELYARKGARQDPPVESGGALLGCPVTDPESGEFGVVVTEVLELIDPDEQPLTLAYSGETWARIREITRRRQRVCGAEDVIGQCHGHPFSEVLFAQMPPCDRCHDLSQPCGRTNACPSEDDWRWHRSVFVGRAPWQLCDVFGFDRRGPRHGCFTLHGGQFVERGFHIVDEFDVSQFDVVEGQ